MNKPILYIFSGLPGAGKSTVAQALSHTLQCAYLRIDTIEQALRDQCHINVVGEGYRLAYRVAVDNLNCGMSVVADSCNPIELTREEWQSVAIDAGCEYVNVEVICSDLQEHKRRVEGRAPSVEGLSLPTWEMVQARDYQSWKTDRVLLDTAGVNPKQSLDMLLGALGH
jgi:predicted kinase